MNGLIGYQKSTHSMAKNSLPWLKYDPVKVGADIAMLDGVAVKGYITLMHYLWRDGPCSEADVRKFTAPEFHSAIMARMTAIGEQFSYAWLEAAREDANRTSTAQAGRASKRWAGRKKKDAESSNGLTAGMQPVSPGMPGHAAGMQILDVRVESNASPIGEGATVVALTPVLPVVNENPATRFGKEDINACMDHLTAVIGGRPQGSVAKNRQYCHNLLGRMKEKYPDRDPVERVKSLIDRGRKTFMAPQVSDFVSLFYKYESIIEAIRQLDAKGAPAQPASPTLKPWLT